MLPQYAGNILPVSDSDRGTHSAVGFSDTASVSAVADPYATVKRRAVVVLANRSGTSGRAFLRAVVSILAAVTAFHVNFILPGPSVASLVPCCD